MSRRPSVDGWLAPGAGIEQVARDAAGALGVNTARAVRSDLRLYAAWCSAAPAHRCAIPTDQPDGAR